MIFVVLWNSLEAIMVGWLSKYWVALKIIQFSYSLKTKCPLAFSWLYSEKHFTQSIWPELARHCGQQRSSRAKNWTIKFFTIWSSRMHARTTFHLLGFYSQEVYTSVEDPINYAIRKWVHPRSQIWSPLTHERHKIVQAVWQTPKWFPWVSRYGMNLLRSCQLQIKLESAWVTWANVIFSLDFNKKFSRWSTNIKVENTKGKYHVWKFRVK